MHRLGIAVVALAAFWAAAEACAQERGPHGTTQRDRARDQTCWAVRQPNPVLTWWNIQAQAQVQAQVQAGIQARERARLMAQQQSLARQRMQGAGVGIQQRDRDRSCQSTSLPIQDRLRLRDGSCRQ